jgi:hypothetical protein
VDRAERRGTNDTLKGSEAYDGAADSGWKQEETWKRVEIDYARSEASREVDLTRSVIKTASEERVSNLPASSLVPGSPSWTPPCVFEFRDTADR